MSDERVRIEIAPSFYASLNKLSPEAQSEVMRMIGELSDLTPDELMARAKTLSPEEIAELLGDDDA